MTTLTALELRREHASLTLRGYEKHTKIFFNGNTGRNTFYTEWYREGDIIQENSQGFTAFSNGTYNGSANGVTVAEAEARLRADIDQHWSRLQKGEITL